MKYVVSDFQTQVMIQTGILILLIGVSNVTAGVYKRKCCNPQQMARYLTVNTFSQTISEKHLPSLNEWCGTFENHCISRGSSQESSMKNKQNSPCRTKFV